MKSSEQILETAAHDGSIDIEEWPRVLETLLKRLHDIVHTGFPLPPPPAQRQSQRAAILLIDPEVVATTPPASSLPRALDASNLEDDLPDAGADENVPPTSSQSSTKENDEPAGTDRPSAKPPVPRFDEQPDSRTLQTLQSASRSSQDGDEISTLPPDLLSSYASTTHLLRRDFAHAPPYTLQRLAELILRPRKHYNFLQPYLRALDRIVSVSSPLTDFPLPTAPLHTNGSSTFLTNGETQSQDLGSDESLGGALLTPIPWLRHNSQVPHSGTDSQVEGELHSLSTETIQGPNGAGSIETVSVTLNGISSSATLGALSSSPSTSTPASPTLSEQSDASTGSSTNSVTNTETLLREQGGVTQGELLRQEQEAGVVPVVQHAIVGRAAAVVGSDDLEVPHARGPDEVGVEDMGPQHGTLGAGAGAVSGVVMDLEAAVGRVRSPLPDSGTGEREVEMLDAAEPKGERGNEGSVQAEPNGRPVAG